MTLIDYTINTFNNIGGGVDTAFTQSVVSLCRSKLGSRCVLGNHALTYPLYSSDAAIYAMIQTAGPPISFQTQAPQGMGCLWTGTIAQGIALGANSIEVWPNFGGFTGLAPANIQTLNAYFAAVPKPTPTGTPVATPPACSGFH